MSMKQSLKEQAEHLSQASGVKKLGFLIVVAASVYGDVAFYQIVGGSFANGLLQLGGLLGCFLITASIIGLLIGKSRWFSPGDQLYTAYGFTVVEGIMMALNVLLSYQMYHHNVTGEAIPAWIAWWGTWCPISPFITAAGWIALAMTSTEEKQRHEQRAHEDALVIMRLEHERERQQAELNFEHDVHKAHMEVKHSHLADTIGYLQQAARSTHAQQVAQLGAEKMLLAIMADVTKLPQFALHQLGSPTVDADPSRNAVTLKKTDEQKDTADATPASQVDVAGFLQLMQQVLAPPQKEVPSEKSFHTDVIATVQPKADNSPLESPQMDAASQTGMSNGNGHQK